MISSIKLPNLERSRHNRHSCMATCEKSKSCLYSLVTGNSVHVCVPAGCLAAWLPTVDMHGKACPPHLFHNRAIQPLRSIAHRMHRNPRPGSIVLKGLCHMTNLIPFHPITPPQTTTLYEHKRVFLSASIAFFSTFTPPIRLIELQDIWQQIKQHHARYSHYFYRSPPTTHKHVQHG